MQTEEFREMALSFPGVIEKPHFDRAAFKAINKRIFATLDASGRSINLKLPVADQATFCSYNQHIIFPVPNKWGLQGWTIFNLSETPPDLMLNAMETAYKNSIH
ncbi:MAG: MmcQ/YjbR family DNA-binding protein [Bacteroidales bacterium]|nr:MmcQ/YjbR family DNA-binding protein [Bacteroidales bacterium]